MADLKRTTKCPDCSRLWEEYTQATRAQITLMEQLSTVKSDFQKVRRIEEKIDGAARGREKAWQRIQEHESQAHPGKAPGR